MLKFQNIGKIIKNLISLFLLVVFLVLVDFKDLSFKTVVPQPEIKIDEKMGSGIVKNIQKEKPEKIDENFQGNEQDILTLVNQAREESGAEPLVYNEKLALSALDKAQHMKENEYFDHVSPQGLQPWYFAQKRNYEYKNFGENLAEGFFSAESVHEGWMNSDGHRENILSRKFQEIGVGILDFTENGQKSYLIVQHFGSQLTPEDLVVKTICDKQSMNSTKINKIKQEYQTLKKELENPDNFSDSQKMTQLNQDLSEIKETFDKISQKELLEKQIKENEEIINSETGELQEMAKEEKETLETSLSRINSELEKLLLPTDPRDKKNIIVEIRAGAGGDEASLFAGELFKMYSRYAEKKWLENRN
jgi:uncharacterized protein YkwD